MNKIYEEHLIIRKNYLKTYFPTHDHLALEENSLKDRTRREVESSMGSTY